MRVFLRRTVRAVRIVAQHNAIPKPLRWLAALGLLPIPGPFDEVVLLLVAGILFAFYRPQLRDAWKQAEGEGTVHPGRTRVTSRSEAGVSDQETR